MSQLPLFATAYGTALEGRFELLDLVGRGSFGDVWKARRTEDSATVALKIPRDQELGEEVLRREPDLMRAFDHPHIVRVFGCYTINSLFVIEMEYVAGRSLADMLDGVNRDNPLSYKRILLWARQILSGLEELHASNVAHNDIKPQNVLIDEAGSAKLVDFGTSRRLEDVWVWTRRQGTEAYWAPEVAFEERRSLLSDIYSVGVMLYEMVTGELPYKSPFELASGRVIKRPREINSNISPELERIVLHAMERDPQMRYQSCAEMLHDVEELLQQMLAGEVAIPPDRTRVARVPFRPDTSSPLYYLEQAKELLAADDLPGALQAAEKALERSSQHPAYLRLLGSIYMRMGYLNRATDTYERVLDAYERDFPATNEQMRDLLERLGKLYIQTQQYRQAVTTYERLLGVTDDRIYAQFRLAVALGLDADYQRSIALLEKVRHERPDAVVVYSKLGWAYMLDGNWRQALSYFNQALLIDPGDLRSLFELGKYHWITGKRTQAKQYFGRVCQYDRSGEYRLQVQEILGEA
jgi:tetratricopeptide (TPR) repeat protein